MFYMPSGWGVSMGMVLICVGLEYENYGGKYHCWLQMDTKYVIVKSYIYIITLHMCTIQVY